MADEFDTHVVVLSGQPGSRKRLGSLLLRHCDTVRWFSTRQECLRGLRTRPCDVLIIDCDGSATEEMGVLAEPALMGLCMATIVLVEAGDVSRVVEAMKLGARDCLEKPVQEEPLLAAMDPVLSGKRQHAVGMRILSQTEIQVLQMILDGKTTVQIASTMHRSARTVEVHRRNIMRKLNVCSTVDLVKWAVAAGLVGRTSDDSLPE